MTQQLTTTVWNTIQFIWCWCVMLYWNRSLLVVNNNNNVVRKGPDFRVDFAVTLEELYLGHQKINDSTQSTTTSTPSSSSCWITVFPCPCVSIEICVIGSKRIGGYHRAWYGRWFWTNLPTCIRTKSWYRTGWCHLNITSTSTSTIQVCSWSITRPSIIFIHLIDLFFWFCIHIGSYCIFDMMIP